MQSKKLGRAAAAAGLLALLLPSAAFASWWDGGYDGRYDSGYDGRRGDSPPRNEDPPGSDTAPEYGDPEEAPPQEGGQPPAENPPPDDFDRPPDCGQADCGPPSGPPECGQPGCERYSPPSPCAQPDCGAPPPQPCGRPECAAPPPPPECGQPACAQAPPPPPPPPPPFYEPIYGCENSTLSDVQFALHKETSPPPGTPVRPGDEILVDITWDWWSFIGPDLHKAIDCVYINGLFVPGLSGGERPTPNDGHFAFHYFVPLDVPPGSEICDQGFVSGPQGFEEYGRAVSNVVCFPVVLPPPPPPPPSTCCIQPADEASPPLDVYVDTESDRLSQEELPPAALPAAYDVLPRTGGGAGAARLAAAALATATLIRRRTRRR